MNHAHHETYSCLPTFPEWTIHPPISGGNIAHYSDLAGSRSILGIRDPRALCVMKEGESLSCCVKDESRSLGFGFQKLKTTPCGIC